MWSDSPLILSIHLVFPECSPLRTCGDRLIGNPSLEKLDSRFRGNDKQGIYALTTTLP